MDERQESGHAGRSTAPIHLTAKIEGVVLPAWFAVSLCVVTVMATVTLLFCWMTIQSLNREIRILQLHTADMENVLIRQGIATRQDFAQWGASTPVPPPVSPPHTNGKDRE